MPLEMSKTLEWTQTECHKATSGPCWWC